MRKLVYYVGMSLDGYIAGPQGDYDFFPLSEDLLAWIASQYPETVPTHVRPHLGIAPDEPNRRFDTLVMGRGTYEPALSIGVTSPYTHMEQYVVSSTLGSLDDPGVTVVESDPLALVRRLKQADGMDIWLAGGGKLAGAVLAEIDELIIKSYPVVVGDGIPAFTGNVLPTSFTPTDRRQLPDGTQISWLSR